MRGNVHRSSIGSYEFVGKPSVIFGVPPSIFICTNALIAIIGQVGQNVVLPIWFSSAPNGGSFDGYFVLLYTCSWFSFIFGLCSLWQYWMGQLTVDDWHHFTQIKYLKQDFFVAFFTAINGLFIVFAAPGSRTPPFLQTVFSNVMIPFVLIIRFFVLRKVPNCVQFLCALGVMIGLFITAYPALFDQNPTAAMKTQAKGQWRVIWPLLFLFGFLPAALYTVFEEKYLQQTGDEDEDDSPQPIALFLFLVTVFQTFTFLFFFWVDFVPTYGFAGTFKETWTNFAQSVRWSWGLDGAGYKGPLGCWMFILMYCLQNFGAAMLLRYTEGATWTALVQALVTPVGEVFWMLFGSSEHLGWNPSWKVADWYAIAGLCLMMPCVYIYNKYSEGHIPKKSSLTGSYARAHDDGAVNLRPSDKTVETDKGDYSGAYAPPTTQSMMTNSWASTAQSQGTSLHTPER